MQLAKVRTEDGQELIVTVEGDELHRLDLSQVEHCRSLADILHSRDPIGFAKFLLDPKAAPLRAGDVRFLAPIDQQEVWAAGVTYRRSQVARMEESETGASHYDRVYTADRPELFFKATPGRVSGPEEPVRVRYDSNWSVPEPELTLVVSPAGTLAGFTIGNDMSARDIEGENPLYLPQAKLYSQCCALGPCVLVPEQPLDRAATTISMTIARTAQQVFHGETTLDQMVREFDDLIGWLMRENEISQGAFLLTGTGIVPPDEFTLQDGDLISITIDGIGTLKNPVVKSNN